MKRTVIGGIAAALSGLAISSGVAQAAPPDVENQYVSIVQQRTGTTADRQTILDASYDDICGPPRPMTGFDLAGRLGISFIEAADMTGPAVYTGLCY